jgi:hypothetical protein
VRLSWAHVEDFTARSLAAADSTGDDYLWGDEGRGRTIPSLQPNGSRSATHTAPQYVGDWNDMKRNLDART